MPSHKSAEKALRQTKRKEALNKARKNKVRASIKKLEQAIAAKNKKVAQEELRKVESEIKRAVSKKVFKLNTASRKVSRLSAKVKAIKTA